MVSSILQNLVLLGGLALLALGLVWGFFRLFSPLQPGKAAPKWRTPAAAAGWVAVYTALIGIYVPLINRQPREVLVQETRYGAVELDVNRLFETVDSNRRIGIPKSFYVAADTSFYLQPPDPTFWLQEIDSVPSLRKAIALQGTNLELQFGGFFSSMLGVPSYEDQRVRRFCAADIAERQLIYTTESRINSVPVTFNPFTERAYWRQAAKMAVAALREQLPDSLRAELDAEGIDDADIDQVIEQWKSTFGPRTPPLPRQYLFRNSICVLSFRPDALEPEILKTLDLPPRPLQLMRFAKLLEQIIPSFSLGTLRDVVTSTDGRALLARDPLDLQVVTLEGKSFDRLAVEQLYLLGVAPERAYFVQVQFMLAPGQEMGSWRQIQQSLRSLRFVVQQQ